MLNPLLGKLINKYDSKYQLVLDVAKYARHISQKADDKGEILIQKPVDLAIDELAKKLEKSE